MLGDSKISQVLSPLVSPLKGTEPRILLYEVALPLTENLTGLSRTRVRRKRGKDKSNIPKATNIYIRVLPPLTWMFID